LRRSARTLATILGDPARVLEDPAKVLKFLAKIIKDPCAGSWAGCYQT